MFAVRNPKLCTKDCLCLYVCPTGATSTEDGTIDADKCIDGCRLCVDVCPSHAIYLVPERYPQRSGLSGELLQTVAQLLNAKADTTVRARAFAQAASDERMARVLEGLARSNQILGEDCVRAAGYLVPQAKQLTRLLESGILRESVSTSPDSPAAESLTAILERVVAALRDGRDADPTPLCICRTCGYVAATAAPDACPNCQGAGVEEIPAD